MAMPGKLGGKRSSIRARVQCAHLQAARNASADSASQRPSVAAIESAARSSLTSQAITVGATVAMAVMSNLLATRIVIAPMRAAQQLIAIAALSVELGEK